MPVHDAQTLFDQSIAASDLSAKQQAVLRASLKLFAAQGFDRTTTHDIATAAGVSEGTVYKKFKTKNEILAAILSPFVHQVIPRVAADFVTSALHDEPGDFGDLLRGVLADRLQFALQNGQVIKILISEVFQNPDLARELTATFNRLVTDQFMPIIEHYQAAGQVVAGPPQQILARIVGTVAGDVFPALLQGQAAVDVQAMAAQECAFLLKGLRPD